MTSATFGAAIPNSRAFNMDKSATAAALIYNLCSRVSGLSGGNVSKSYQFAISCLSADEAHKSVGELDEFATAELIQKKLIKENRVKDALLFAELHRKLQTSPLLRNRAAVLQLFLMLSNAKNLKSQPVNFVSQNVRNTQLSPVFARNNNVPKNYVSPSHKILNGGDKNAYNSAPTSDVISFKCHPELSALPAIHAGKNEVKKAFLGGEREKCQNELSSQTGRPGNRIARISAMFVNKEKLDPQSDMGMPVGGHHHRDKSPSAVVMQKHHQNNLSKTEELPRIDVSEKDLIRELLFVFQGIEGRVLRKDPATNTFALDPKAKLRAPVKELVSKLAYMGELFLDCQIFHESKSHDFAYGLVGQSFVAAIHEQLTEYYRLLAVLESQLQRDSSFDENGMTSGLTLRRLMVWCVDPLVRMRYLSALVHDCAGQKGGALASTVYGFLSHGDPVVRDLVKHILTKVAQPIMSMLKRWMFNGELEDAYQEFFVASNPNASDESNMWYEKYSLRKKMVPSFLSHEEAKKILSTGKAINFLRQVCNDHTEFKGQNWLKKELSFNTIEALFSHDKDSEFQMLLDKTYSEISQHVLSVLHQRFKFTDHLQAMRRYMLLGQGDFIRHLMDLLKEELDKPAISVQLHNLSGILECAIRSTNAQFDNPDILKCLDVQMNDVSDGDTGWDVFCLHYQTSGPVGTIFTAGCQTTYKKLFHNLWRAKRMEYALSSMWKKQITYSQMLRSVKEVKPLLHDFQTLLGEMVHFVQQMQYYIAFEVMECCWDELQKNVAEARDLDEVIKAHEEFLDRVLNQALLDDKSEELLNRLRLIFDSILKFQKLLEDFWDKTMAELRARAEREESVARNQSTWGLSKAQVEIDEARRAQFVESTLPTVAAQFRIDASHYHSTVHIFLKLLMDHEEQSLRCLSFRLDFNEYYKTRDASLQTSLTFQHRRKSMKY